MSSTDPARSRFAPAWAASIVDMPMRASTVAASNATQPVRRPPSRDRCGSPGGGSSTCTWCSGRSSWSNSSASMREAPASSVTAYRCGPASSLSRSNGRARAARPGSGSRRGLGISWNTPRSPIHGLGMWLVANACRAGRASSPRSAWYRYGQLPAEASVIGMPNTPPCGTVTSGALLPRENRSDACVPRRVSIQPRSVAGRGPAERTATESRKPRPPCSTAVTVSIVRPANGPRSTIRRFH